jgi:hypothetical protein
VRIDVDRSRVFDVKAVPGLPAPRAFECIEEREIRTPVFDARKICSKRRMLSGCLPCQGCWNTDKQKRKGRKIQDNTAKDPKRTGQGFPNPRRKVAAIIDTPGDTAIGQLVESIAVSTQRETRGGNGATVGENSYCDSR